MLTGGRQTGKTSLLKHLFPNYHFVSLDLPSEARLAEEDPEAFLRRHPAPLIIDEVQYAPGLFRYLKVLIDRDRDLNGRFLLTGSQKFSLVKAGEESLAGRIDVLDLETLSLNEVLRSGASNGSPPSGGDSAAPDYLRVMIRGGYPELNAKPSLDHRMFYSSFVASYLERHVKGILNVTSLRDFERFLRACALRSGQILNKSDLARDVDFIEDRGGRYRLFECKWNQNPSTKDALSILYVRKELNETRVDAAYIISRSDHTYPLGDSVLVTPPHDLGLIV